MCFTAFSASQDGAFPGADFPCLLTLDMRFPFTE